MKLSHWIFRALLCGSVLILAGSAVHAGQVWTVSLDTSQLAANYTGPFAVDFELVGSNGNTVTLSGFSFGAGGSAGPGAAFLTGGASGDLGSTVSMTDTASFFSDYNQQFKPAGSLMFTMESTLVSPSLGGSPDNFSMVVFEGYDPFNGYNPLMGTGGTPIPTTDPSGADTFFNFNIDGPGSTDVNAFSSASGDVSITVTLAGAVPEPTSGVLMLLGAICMATLISLVHYGAHQRRSSSQRFAGARRDPCSLVSASRVVARLCGRCDDRELVGSSGWPQFGNNVGHVRPMPHQRNFGRTKT